MINNLYIKATPTTASVTWGDITGTLSDQTDLQSALDDKQDALTLTTTGTSGAATLVGSTLNIPQYSGGGGGLSGGSHVITKLPSGSIYSNIPYGGANTNFTLNANAMYLMPFTPSNSFTTSDMLAYVTTVAAGVNFRILLYSHSDTTGLPDVLIYQSPDLSASTTGVKTATTTQNFNAGTTYWLGVYSSGTTVLSGTVIASLRQIGMDSILNQYTSVQRTITYGSAPNPFGTTHNKNNSTIARIGLKIA